MLVIDRGNHSWADYEVQGEVVIEGGNFGGTNYIPGESATLSLLGGNQRGVGFDGVRPADAAGVPSWVTVGPNVNLEYGWTKPPKCLPLASAVQVIDAFESARFDRKMWRDVVAIILEGSESMTEAQFVAGVVGINPFLDASKLIVFLNAQFETADWNALRTEIRKHDSATWRGDATQEEAS